MVNGKDKGRASRQLRYRWICCDCGREYAAGEGDGPCPSCASPLPNEAGAKGSRPDDAPGTLRGILRAEYAPEALFSEARRFPRAEAFPLASFPESGNHARYLDLLPIEEARSLPPLPVGPTPLLAVPRLRERLDLPRLFVKNDTLLPTGSLKDRASSVVVARAREKGVALIVTASTGNAATSLAGMCAACGLRAIVLVPARAPSEKLVQMLHYGALVCPVEGSYDDAFRLSLAATQEFGWYNRSTAYHPCTIEGKKTVAFEIWEQLGRRAPDAVFVPVGDGAVLAGVEKGFADLLRLGLVERIPRLVAVQATGSASIAEAWRRGERDARKVEARTIADSISVSLPANGRWALRAIRDTRGGALTVSDDAILSAMCSLASEAGVYAEPAAAAPLAGLLRAREENAIERSETIVLLVTGSGLKDLQSARRAVTLPEPLPLRLDALRERVEREIGT